MSSLMGGALFGSQLFDSKKLIENDEIKFVLISFAHLFFLYITKFQMSFMDSIDWVDANDVHSYLKIAKAAPFFPTEKIAFHFAQRFIPHYLVGLISWVLNLKMEISYYLVNGSLLFFILYFSARIIFKRTTNKSFAFLLFSLFALSPFSFRLNVFVPGLLADLVFVLGLTISINAIMSKKFLWLVAGMLIATCGKQMSLLVLPGVILYAYSVFREEWTSAKIIQHCSLLALIVVIFNKSLAFYSEGFALPNFITSKVLFSLFSWIFSSEFIFTKLLEHLLRVFLPSFVFLGILFVFGFKKDKKQFLESCSFFLMVSGPAAYAFLPGPIVQMGNQSRYVASAMLPMILFTLNLVDINEIRFKPLDFVILLILLLAFSYHHRYCYYQSSPMIFLVIHFMSLFIFFIWFRAKKYNHPM